MSNTLIGVQVPASAPAMYGFGAITSALKIHKDIPLEADLGTTPPLMLVDLQPSLMSHAHVPRQEGLSFGVIREKQSSSES